MLAALLGLWLAAGYAPAQDAPAPPADAAPEIPVVPKLAVPDVPSVVESPAAALESAVPAAEPVRPVPPAAADAVTEAPAIAPALEKAAEAAVPAIPPVEAAVPELPSPAAAAAEALDTTPVAADLAPVAAPIAPGAAELEKNTPRARMYDAMLNVQDGKYDEAIPKLESVIAEDPTLIDAWETLTWAYWLGGRPDDARRLAKEFIGIAPDEPVAHNIMAQFATRDGELAEAERLYRRSLELKPDQYETRFAFASVLLWNGKFDEAMKELNDLYKLDPERLDVELQLARALTAFEEYEEALVHWDHINEMVPDYPEYMMARAEVLVLIGSLKEAQAEAERVLDLEPDNLAALNLLADIAMRERKNDEVVKALKRVRDLADGDEAKAMVERRLAYFMKAEHDRDPATFTMDQVVQAGQDCYRRDPGDVNGHLFYAEMMTLDKDYGRAEEHFRKVLEEKNPHSDRALFGLFQCYLGRMMLDDAERQLRSNLRDLNPRDPYRHLMWAQLYFARGRFRDAMESLNRLEQEGAQGSVFTLQYQRLSSSEWTPYPSVRQFRDHLMTLKRAGFRFLPAAQFPAYFETCTRPERVQRRPLMYRILRSIRNAWTGEKDELLPMLSDYVPDRVACVTFDDGLRSTFRWAAPLAEDLRIPMTVFVSVGHILSNDIRSATFPELKAHHDTGLWEIDSHLVFATIASPTNRESRLVHQLPNLLWVEEKERQETLREYYARLRYEFTESQRMLQKALGVETDLVTSVAYPHGDIGQATYCNIDLFNVPEAVLNEAEIHYRQGFLQSRYGYAMKLDHQMMLQRWEPDRHASGQDVLRQALKNHPVFLARRTRAEMAALQGEMHLALDMIKLLKRDGYPDKDLQELNAFVRRHLSRLVAVPEAVKDETGTTTARPIEIRHPYLGVEGYSTKANVMIDEWHVAFKGGLNINPRLTLEGRVGYGQIDQTVSSNFWTLVNETNTEVRRDITTTIENGTNTVKDETVTTISTTLVGTNIVETTNYSSSETLIGLASSYIFPNGSIGTLDVRQRSFSGDLAGESVLTYSLEYLWRPVLPLDMSVRYEHGMVPSARAIIEYDGAGLGAIWRAKDEWNATGTAAYWSLDDDNSLLRLMLENYWRISERYDIWLGLHDSLITADRASDLYWTPYWEQRHYLIIRLRRSYPNYFGMVRVNIGAQQSEGRPEEWAVYNERAARAEGQGWYPGNDPDQDWERLIGFSASLRRSWANGWEIEGEATVNSLREQTERSLIGSVMYRF